MSPFLLVIPVAIAVLLLAKKANENRIGPVASTSSSPLSSRLLSATLELLPSSSTVLKPGDPIVDIIYGGRRPDVLGGPTFGYYSTYLREDKDGNKVSGGTTCAITLAYLMGKAGWPADMINRLSTDVVPGGGFVPGAHITRMVTGARARKRGWYIDHPTELLPGDAYHIDHPEKPNSDHVGEVVGVGEKRADGTRLIETADGGQGHPGYYIHRNTRTLSADGKTLTLNGVPARVLGVIRPKKETVA